MDWLLSLLWAVIFVLWPIALLNVALIFVPARRDFGRWPRIVRICMAGNIVLTAAGLTAMSLSFQHGFGRTPSWVFVACTIVMTMGVLFAICAAGIYIARPPAAAAALHMPPRLHAWLYSDDAASMPGDHT